MISLVINADTRPGYLTSTLGEGWGKTSLHGVRSVDFLTEGVKQKIKFFNGYDIQLILYIDKHEDIPEKTFKEIMEIVESCGNNSKIVFKPHDRISYKWNDKIYIEALKLADGDYVCHVDQDCNLFRDDNCEIIWGYTIWLDDRWKYICQPWDGIGDEMFHASTRFFICKKETLKSALKQDILKNPLKGIHSPCLEHALGIIAGKGNVLYPKRNDDNYLIFSWATYYPGTLKRLNEMPYEDVKKYILQRGIHGPNDVVDKPMEI